MRGEMLMLPRAAIPFIPEAINPSILSQGRLISPQVMSQIQGKLANGELQPGRISKKTLKAAHIDSNYSVIALSKNEVYVICPGEKQGMLVGRGTYGNVKLVQNAEGEFLVLKLQKQNEKNKDTQTKEFTMLKQAGQGVGSVTYQSPSKNSEIFAVIMPLALGEEGITPQKMAPIQRINVCINAIQELNKLHKNNKLLHLDIKPENLMIDPVSGKVTIIDFGTSLAINDKGKAEGKLIGSPLYMAAELLQGFVDTYFKKASCPTISYSSATDVYSLGLALANMLMLTDQKEFYNKFSPYVVAQPGSDIFNKNQLLTDPSIRMEVVALLSKMTAENPKDRPSLDAAEKEFNNIFSGMNTLDTYKLKIAIVDINEFKFLTSDARSEMIKQLKSFDQVQLVANNNKIDIDLAVKVINLLDASLVPVRRDVFYHREAGVDLVIKTQ